MFWALHIGNHELYYNYYEYFEVFKKILSQGDIRGPILNPNGCPHIARGLVYFKQYLACPH